MTDLGFTRPALSELVTRIEADFNSRLQGADSRLRRSFLKVMARVQAGLVHGLYGFLNFIARQCLVDTCEDEFLDRHGSIWGVARKAATKTTGAVPVTGTSGSAINTGTILQRNDGFRFVTMQATAISGGGTATLQVEAITAGEAGNTDEGTLLTFISPIAGVDPTTSSGALAGGTDTESDDNYRSRILERIQQPPQGGDANDYVEWALSVSGVTRAWTYGLELGAGTVTVRFMMDDTYSDGIPAPGDVATVKTYIDTVRPVTADVHVVAPTAQAVNFSILLKKKDGTTETDPTIRAAVQAEMADMFRRDAEPGGKMFFSRMNEAVSIAAGEYDHVISTPSADVTLATGTIAKVGTFTWL
jgi:uncharacterized phage protein gp47/JayE